MGPRKYSNAFCEYIMCSKHVVHYDYSIRINLKENITVLEYFSEITNKYKKNINKS